MSSNCILMSLEIQCFAFIWDDTSYDSVLTTFYCRRFTCRITYDTLFVIWYRFGWQVSVVWVLEEFVLTCSFVVGLMIQLHVSVICIMLIDAIYRWPAYVVQATILHPILSHEIKNQNHIKIASFSHQTLNCNNPSH